MTSIEQLLIKAEIEALNADYWHDVDRLQGRNAHEFFEENGIYTTSARARQGRAAIAEFYSSRQQGRTRTARHVASNLRVGVQDADNAVAVWVLQLFAADGEPVRVSEPANLIGDVHDVCRRGSDGRWRYVSRTITPVFKSGNPTTS